MQEGDARVFQEVMTADSGPIGRQVVCPRPWMLPQDSWMPIGRRPGRFAVTASRKDCLT
jgi:hypothetical protein